MHEPLMQFNVMTCVHDASTFGVFASRSAPEFDCEMSRYAALYHLLYHTLRGLLVKNWEQRFD